MTRQRAPQRPVYRGAHGGCGDRGSTCTVQHGLAALESHRSMLARTHPCHGLRGHIRHGVRPHGYSPGPLPRSRGMADSARLAAAVAGAVTRGDAATSYPPSLSAAAVWSAPFPLSNGASLPPSTPEHVRCWPALEAVVAAAAALWVASRRGVGARGGEGEVGGCAALREALPTGGGRDLWWNGPRHALCSPGRTAARGRFAAQGRACPRVDRRRLSIYGRTGEKRCGRARGPRRLPRPLVVASLRHCAWRLPRPGPPGHPGHLRATHAAACPRKEVVGCSAAPPVLFLDGCPRKASRPGQYAARGRNTGRLVTVTHSGERLAPMRGWA